MWSFTFSTSKTAIFGVQKTLKAYVTQMQGVSFRPPNLIGRFRPVTRAEVTSPKAVAETLLRDP